MADKEVIGVVVSLDGGETFRKREKAPGSNEVLLTDLADDPTPYIAHAIGPAFEGTTLPAIRPPEFLTKPTITAASSTVGTTLGGTNGTWTGNPMPEFHATIWARGGVLPEHVIAGQNGGTLSTVGFAVGDDIYRGTTIRSVINGQEVFATEWSLPFKLTAVESVQLVSLTDPIVAGQLVTAVFDRDLTAAPQGNTTWTRGADARTWTTTAPADPTANLTFSASLANHETLQVVRDVQPAPAALAVLSDNTVQVINVSDTSDPVSMTITAPTPAEYIGTLTLDPADAADGPVVELAPAITGTGTVGQTLTLQHLGIFGTLGADVTLNAGWPDESVGRTYVVRAQDAGTTVRYAGVAVDSRGTRPFQSNGIAVAASAGLDDGLTVLGLFSGTNTANRKEKQINIDLGPADPAKKLIMFIIGGPGTMSNVNIGSGTPKIIKNGVEYPVGTNLNGKSISGKGRNIWWHEVNCPAGGAAVLDLFTSNVSTYPWHVYLIAVKDASNTGTTGSSVSNISSFSAGVQTSSGRTTQVGDHVIYAAITDQPTPGGMATMTPNLTEQFDAAIGDTHLIVGTGTATVNGTTTSGFTPSVSGAYAFKHVIYRDNI